VVLIVVFIVVSVHGLPKNAPKNIY